MEHNRRQFLKTTTLAATAGVLLPDSMIAAGKAKKIRTLVWDERADTEKEAYDHFLGNYIAEKLKGYPEFMVSSVCKEQKVMQILSNAAKWIVS